MMRFTMRLVEKSDLALTDTSESDLGRSQMIAVVISVSASLASIAVAIHVGIRSNGLLLLLPIGIGVGVWLPVHKIKNVAVRRRLEFGTSFSAFLELVNVMLAGGAGIETALVASSRAGDDWVFVELQRVFEAARVTRQSPWVVLHDFGKTYGLPEAMEVASSIQLAGEQGSRIRHSLATKSTTIRLRQTAAAEARAHYATEQMGIPTVLLFVGFILLLGYPALNSVMGTW